MLEILITSLIIALFCCSWDIILEYKPGEPKRAQMLLYWLRKPFKDHEERLEDQYQQQVAEITGQWNIAIQNELQNINPDELLIQQYQLEREHALKTAEFIKERQLDYQFYLKPILLCKYCFPSFYGTIIFILLNGFHVELWKEWLLSIICSVIMVGIISGVHEKLTK